jgi:cyclic-di-GMP-binding protein
MIVWTRAKPSEHPLADPRDAKELLGDLAKRDGVHVLPALSEYLDGIKTAGALDFKRAFEIIDELDRLGRTHHRGAMRELCLSNGKLTSFQANRIWTTVGEYLVQLAQAYQSCLAAYSGGAWGASVLRNQHLRIIARATRMRAAALTWDYLRYKTHFGDWGELYRLFSLAASLGRESEKVVLYQNGHVTTVERELMQALMMAAGAPHGMLVGQIDVTQHIAAYLGDYLALSANQASRPYYFDPQSQNPPTREVTGLRPPTGARRFGAGDAERELRALVRLADNNRFPRTDLGLQHQSEDLIKATLHHLIRYWCNAPPDRRHPRHRKLLRISVVHGYEEVVANVGNLPASYPFVSEQETWLVEDQSISGFGAIVAAPKGSWVTVGTLIAFRGDNSCWYAGIVRRVKEEDDQARSVGVETLAQGGLGVWLYRHGAQHEEEGTLCVWLSGGEPSSEKEIRLLMPAAAYSPSSTRVMRVHDNQYLLTPVALLHTGADYEVVRYRVMGREDLGEE